MVTSKGGAGVAGAALVALTATLSTHNIIPVAGITLILGVDRILNEVRALVNLIGNAVATIVVARWEGVFDVHTAREVLSAPRVDVYEEETAARDARTEATRELKIPSVARRNVN
jgi:aerobic C4-dicarboxylate transport protein